MMSVEKFCDLNVSEKIKKAINDLGFENLTEIQEKSIPILLEMDSNFVGQAQTGTGKTAAFSIPLLEKISADKDRSNGIQALILAPTRELALQVEKEINKIGKYTGLKTGCVYGGTDYRAQVKLLKHDRPEIVVGTPGRVIDMIEKGYLKLDDASFCVLDEADEMLNMGFFDDVQYIVNLLKESSQLIMFSATMPPQILNLVKKSFKDFEIVRTKADSSVAQRIEQRYTIVQDRYLVEALVRFTESIDDIYAIVFCQTKIETRQVGEMLKKRGITHEVLNGDMGQNEREYALRKFRNQKTGLLVCTDVAARGIDIDNITHVFNLRLPQSPDSYVHRIGRTARAGSSGMAITIIPPRDFNSMERLRRVTKTSITELKLPSVEQLKLKVVAREFERTESLMQAVSDKGSDFKTDSVFEYFKDTLADLSKDQLLKFFFQYRFSQIFRNYDNLNEIDAVAPRGRSDRSGGRSGGGARRGSSRRSSSSRGSRDSRDSGNSRGGSRGSRSYSDSKGGAPSKSRGAGKNVKRKVGSKKPTS